MSRVINMRKHRKAIIRFLILFFAVVIAVSAFIYSYPLKYIDSIKKHSKTYGLEPAFVCAVINSESRFEKGALSNKGARGLMQLMETTATWGAEEIGLSSFNFDNAYDPEINIEIGCWYLRNLLNQYDSQDAAIAAYNAGSGNVSKWLKNPKYSPDGKSLETTPFPQTNSYLEKVKTGEKVYSILLKFI